MRKINQILGLAALVLLAISVFTYWQETNRTERFERGRKLLPNFNPDEVAGLTLEQGEETVTLSRQGDRFLIAEKDGYRAKNAEVNRVLKDLQDLALEKEVGKSDSLAEKLGIEPPGEETVDVKLTNRSGDVTVHLRVGQEFEEGGVYIRRMDEEGSMIYLTENNPRFSTSPDDFLQKSIVDVPASDVKRVEGPDFVVEEVFEDPPPAEPAVADLEEPSSEEATEEGEGEEGSETPPAPEPVSLGLKLAEVPAGQREKASAMNKVKGVLSLLQYEEVYPADDPQVAGLTFERKMRVSLDDTSGYILSTAQKEDRTFLRIEGFSTVDRVEIREDESEEELSEKAESLTRADEIAEFNAFHGSWVYEIEERFAEKLALTKGDLVEAGG